MKLNNPLPGKTWLHAAPTEPGRKMVWEAINTVLLRNLASAAAQQQYGARVIVAHFEPCTLARINIAQAGAEKAEAKSNS